MRETFSGDDFAPDMAVFVICLPLEKIVLLSWIVSEYDGLGFVKSENMQAVSLKGKIQEHYFSEKQGLVSLFFPEEKRGDVLELLIALRDEGMDLEILFERRPECISLSEEDAAEVWILEDFDTL